MGSRAVLDGWRKKANVTNLSAVGGQSLAVLANHRLSLAQGRNQDRDRNTQKDLPGSRHTGIGSGLAAPRLTP